MAEMAQKADSYSKIHCRSRRAVNSVVETICSQLENTLKQSEERADDERKRYMQRFKEIYEATIQQNVLVNGQSWETSSVNDTSEFEPVDVVKEKCINDELLPRLDDCIVSVARKRKQYPRSCRAAVTDYSNHQAAYMSKVKPQLTDSPAESGVSDIDKLQITNLIQCDRLQPPSTTLASLTKITSEDYERAVHLSKAVEVQQADRHCKTAAVVFSGSPGFCELEQSASTAKRKLAMSPTTSEVPAKAPRTGVNVFGNDFVVEPFIS